MIIRAVDTQRINRRTHIAAYLNPAQRHEAAEYARAAGRNVEYVGTTGLKITRKTIMDRQRAWAQTHPIAYRATLFCVLLMIPYVGWTMDAYYAIKWTRDARRNHTPRPTHPPRTKTSRPARPHGHTPRPMLTGPVTRIYTATVQNEYRQFQKDVEAANLNDAYAFVWARLREYCGDNLQGISVYITEA